MSLKKDSFTAFAGERCIGSGPIEIVALLARSHVEAVPDAAVLFFADDSGKQLDLDLRGTETEVLARLAEQFPVIEDATDGDEGQTSTERARGRPKLGVVAREVTLLPRHWEWLNRQPGSASVALRKLVDEARRTYAERDERQRARNASSAFMMAMAGDRPHFEEANRALFAGDRQRFLQCIDAWPVDIRRHAERLAAGAFMAD